MTAWTVTSIGALPNRLSSAVMEKHQQHHRQHNKQELCDGIRRKQTRFRHATALPEDDERHCRGGRLRAGTFGAVRVDRTRSNKNVKANPVEPLRSPVRYLVR